MVYVPLEKVLFKWRCMHVTIAGEGLQNLSLCSSLMAFGTPALTQVISLCCVIGKSTLFSCLILGSCLAWHVRGTVKLLYPKSQRDFIWFLMNSIYILQWNLSNQNSTGRLVLVLEYFNKQSFRLNSVKRKHRI